MSNSIRQVVLKSVGAAVAASVLVLSAPSLLAQETVEDALVQLRIVHDNDAATGSELQGAIDLTETIVEKFPTSDVAVSILLGEQHSGIDFGSFQRRLDGQNEPQVAPIAAAPAPLDPLACISGNLASKPTVDLEIDVKLDEKGSIVGLPSLRSPLQPSSEERQLYFQILAVLETCGPYQSSQDDRSLLLKGNADGTLAFAAFDETKTEPDQELQEESSVRASSNVAAPRPKKVMVKEIQTELNRVGCNAGSADGIMGAKTRSAFKRFVKETGASVTLDDLPSEEVVNSLKAYKGKACKTRTMSGTPVSQLGGSWGFRGDCPGLFGRTVRNKGRIRFQFVGNNTLRGTVTNQKGISGPASIQFRGRKAVTNMRFGLFTLKGELWRSKKNMTVSGTGTRKCKIVLWKN